MKVVDQMDLLTEEEYFDVLDYPSGRQPGAGRFRSKIKFIAKMGAEAIFDLLAKYRS